jgi:plasmid stabilization system protein ParE
MVLALGLALPPALPAAAAGEPGAATPEELVTRLKAAAEDDDFAEIAACIAPRDRAQMAMMMVAAAGMMVAFAQMGSEMAEGMAEGMAEAFAEEDDAAEDAEETAEETAEAAGPEAMEAQVAAIAGQFEALLERHGLDEILASDPPPEGSGPEALEAALADVDQVALIADVMRFMQEAMPGTEGEEAAKSPVPVGDLEDLVVDGDRATGKVGGEDAHFVRVDGRWYVALDVEQPGAE